MNLKYEGLKATLEFVFTLLSVSMIFWSQEFSAGTAIVFFMQNIIVCYNTIDNKYGSDIINVINISTICIDAIAIFLSIGVFYGQPVLIIIIKICYFWCIARDIYILGYYCRKIQNEE